jgi:hypothetical protein
MRGFPKWLNTPVDLDNCKKMFPEETKATLSAWLNDSKPVEITDEKTGIKTQVINISSRLDKVKLTTETAAKLVTDISEAPVEEPIEEEPSP